jgi:predicted metal-dependent peptidase
MSNLTAEDRILKSHIALMQDTRTLAYSGIIMVGKAVITDDIDTAATNGRDVFYGREFVDGLTDQELRGLVLHEAKHKLYQHFFIWQKLFEEDHELTNAACDFVINLEIQDIDKSGQFIKLPACGCIDEQYRGMNTAEVYAKLKKQYGDKQSRASKGGKGLPEGLPEGLDEHQWQDAVSLSPEEREQLSREIDSAVRTGALLAGKQGGDIDRNFEALMESKVDWREQLREFVSSTCAGKGDSTWAKPSRRWLSQDIYMPSQISETVGSMCVAIDTSGSIDDEAITKALSEVVAICDNTTPEKVDLLYWDTDVASHEQYREDNYAGLVNSTKPKGGGGSSSIAVFEYINNTLPNLPEVCIMITDGYIEFPKEVPKYPVIWVLMNNTGTVPPFGSIIRVD